MPHTRSRYMQDMGFTDATISIDAPMDAFIVSGGSTSNVRNAAGDNAVLAPASATTTFGFDLLNGLMCRTGFNEDIQDAFGSTFGSGLGGQPAGPGGPGTGIPGSADVQGRPGDYTLPGQPQPPSGMATLQELLPRTGFKLKGIKPMMVFVIYKVLTGAATTLTCRLDSTTLANGVAVAPVSLLASGANGLVNVAAATPYVTQILIPNANYYQVTDFTQLWFEITVVEPAVNTFQLYGIKLHCSFNFN